MSYNNIDWLQRSSVDSVNKSRMSVDSCMRPSVDDSVHMKVVTDALHLRLNSLNEVNCRIRKRILQFADLNDAERKEVRGMLSEGMQLAEDIQSGVKK